MADHYIGRFAPSPSGPLHFGSLLTALASYLDARAAGGTWLVRIEDIDPPRQAPHAADTILRQLDSHGLHWDGEVVYQSRRQPAYAAALAQLDSAGLTYSCACSRARIQSLGGRYDGICRHRAPAAGPSTAQVALRMRADNILDFRFTDLFQARPTDAEIDVGDFVLRRRDQLIGYHLAVTVDDAAQRVTQVIRGSDLLSSTPPQLLLFAALGQPAPQYGHVPVVVDAEGRKLSKQNGARAVACSTPSLNLYQALRCLNQPAPAQLARADPGELLRWAIAHWQRELVPKCPAITARTPSMPTDVSST